MEERATLRPYLCDGERSLWTYAESNPLFTDYRMLVDFYHTCEHLADAAEALWGTGSPKANQWYEEYRHREFLCNRSQCSLSRDTTGSSSHRSSFSPR